MPKTTEDQLKELQEQVKNLTKELTSETAKRSDAEELAASLSAAGHYMGNTSDEQPTGRTVVVEKCANPWERNEKKQKFVDIDLPTYYYTINLPSGAGNNLSTNGVEYYHGQTYEFDPYILSEMKSRVARCWDHEKSIKGDDENVYRKKTASHF